MAKQKVIAPWEAFKALVDEYQLTLGQMATDLKLSVSMVRQVLVGKSKISPHMALRLSKYFNLTPEYWNNLQAQYDLAEAQKDANVAKVLKDIPKAKKPKPGARVEKPATKPAKSAKDAKVKKVTPAKASKTSAKAAKPAKDIKGKKAVSPVKASKPVAVKPAKSAKDVKAKKGISPVKVQKSVKNAKAEKAAPPKTVRVSKPRPAKKPTSKGVGLVDSIPEKKPLDVILIKNVERPPEQNFNQEQQTESLPPNKDQSSFESSLFSESENNNE
jgi:addiction module HigA family antidote